MKPYIHRAPGRIRIKNRELKLNNRRASLLKAVYLEKDGVSDVSLNPANGSITIKFDQAAIQQHTILAIASCYMSNVLDQPKSTADKKTTSDKMPSATAKQAVGISRDLAARAGHIAIGVLLEKGVRYSMSNILGLR